MAQAYILLNTETGLEKSVTEKIAPLPNVKEVFMVYGVYDIIVKVAGEDMKELKDIITHKIRSIPGLRSSLTLMII